MVIFCCEILRALVVYRYQSYVLIDVLLCVNHLNILLTCERNLVKSGNINKSHDLIIIFCDIHMPFHLKMNKRKYRTKVEGRTNGIQHKQLKKIDIAFFMHQTYHDFKLVKNISIMPQIKLFESYWTDIGSHDAMQNKQYHASKSISGVQFISRLGGEKSKMMNYCIQEKFRSCFNIALLALWPEGEFKTGLIQLYIKDYVRNFDSGEFKTWRISLRSL